MISRIDYGGSICLLIFVRPFRSFHLRRLTIREQLGSLLVALSFKNNDALPWTDPQVWFPLIISLIFSIGFILVEAFHAAEPVLPLRLLITRNGICVAGANFFMSMVTFSVLYFLPMFFEIVKQQKVAQAGPSAFSLSSTRLILVGRRSSFVAEFDSAKHGIPLRRVLHESNRSILLSDRHLCCVTCVFFDAIGVDG